MVCKSKLSYCYSDVIAMDVHQGSYETKFPISSQLVIDNFRMLIHKIHHLEAYSNPRPSPNKWRFFSRYNILYCDHGVNFMRKFHKSEGCVTTFSGLVKPFIYKKFIQKWVEPKSSGRRNFMEPSLINCSKKFKRIYGKIGLGNELILLWLKENTAVDIPTVDWQLSHFTNRQQSLLQSMISHSLLQL